MPNTLYNHYQKVVIPALTKEFAYQNRLMVPRLAKVVLNTGLSARLNDPQYLERVESALKRISGQKPLRTLAKKSISEFKVRQGMAVGLKVTLRGKRMYDFINKLVNVVLPRVRDFRGLETKSLDGQGNLNIGLSEHLVFPEIRPDEVEKVFGLEVAVITTAKTKEEALALLKALGFPFRQ